MSTPKGLDVTVTGTGFTVSLKGLPRKGPLAGTVFGMLGALLLTGWFASLFVVRIAPFEAACLLLALLLPGVLFWGVFLRSGPTGPTSELTLDAGYLRFTTMDGEDHTLKLDNLKGVDAVPVGLAVRPRQGRAHHIAMLGAPTEHQAWLVEQITLAMRRHGRDDAVPDEIRRLQKTPENP